MQISRKAMTEYVITAISTVATIVMLKFLPSQLMFVGGAVKSKWFLALLAATPALMTYIVTESKKGEMLSTAYLAIAEVAVVLLVLHNKGIYTPNFDVIGMGIISILFIAEAIHLHKDNPMGSSCCLNFKWVTDVDRWKALQKKGSLLVFLEGILLSAMTVLLAFGVLGLSVIIPTMVITIYIMAFYLMKSSK